MWKPMLAGTVMLALAGSSAVLAQQGPAAPGTTSPQATPAPTSPEAPAAKPRDATPDPSAQDRAAAAREREADNLAELEGRVAALRGGLMLTDAQKAKWPAFEKAWRDFAKVRIDQWKALRETRRGDDPFAALQARSQFAIARGTAMKEFADAAEPLYQSLDQAQQRRFRNQVFASLMPGQRGTGSRWADRDRSDGDRRGGDERWSRRGDDGDWCPPGRHRWHHHGMMQEGMPGDWRDSGEDNRPGPGWRGRDDRFRDGDQMGPRGRERMGQRWQDRDDADRDDDDRRATPRTGPDEERF